MAVRKIVFAGEPVLRQKAQKVRQIDKSVEKLIDDMVDTLHEANGLGLAANQVGVAQRVIIIELPHDEEDPQSGKLYALINPEITSYSQELEANEEGCLSIPYYYGEVTRPEAVVVKGRDRKWREVKIKAQGMLARALQHEVDHLNGVLFIDRMENMEKLRYIPARTEAEVETESFKEARAARRAGEAARDAAA
jgi:peptide deformylase